jgi:hypothetical protein
LCLLFVVCCLFMFVCVCLCLFVVLWCCGVVVLRCCGVVVCVAVASLFRFSVCVLQIVCVVCVLCVYVFVWRSFLRGLTSGTISSVGRAWV